MLGIPNYKPDFYNEAGLLIRDHKEVLSKLIDQRLNSYWLMWETKADKWWSEGPVILEIGSYHYELTAYKDLFGLTADRIDISQPLDWYGAGCEIPLKWKANCQEDINKLLGKKIEQINILLEYEILLYGIELVFEPNDNLQIFNFGDEIGISTEKLSSRITKVKIK
ncbi:hypothetical protein IC235_07765 [Hymenobacter sp. BT664]|uniref:Uncharacterized protein n=1 Tax=Hymenobacter montanus TaxID=2771359 RepID=A0A927GIU3_9BACT|nr:hypothetical protein [Hymenobacter montanus]MBD2767787.1 hypothetical protein [Hymenobacter montanus]